MGPSRRSLTTSLSSSGWVKASASTSTTRRLSATEQSCLLPESEMRAVLLREWDLFCSESGSSFALRVGALCRFEVTACSSAEPGTYYIYQKKSILLLRCFIKRFLPAWNKYFVFVFRNQMFFRGMLRYYNYQALKFVL